MIARVSSLRRGGYPSYTSYHVLKALELLSHTPMGRPQLERALGLSEASARTLLRRLKELGMVTVRAIGHKITEEGERVLNSLKDMITAEIEGIPGFDTAAVLVWDLIEPPRSLVDVYKLRDYIIGSGCRSPVIVGGIDGEFLFPGVPSDLRSDITRVLLDLLGPELRRYRVNRGVIMISMKECLPHLVKAALEIVMTECREALGDTRV